jgi:hypothetical protein
MFRLILLVLYLIASSTATTDHGGGWDPLGGLGTPPANTDGGGGADPFG